MKYAHIYKARGGKFTLLISTTPDISQSVISETLFADRKSAKQAAKSLGAVAYNY